MSERGLQSGPSQVSELKVSGHTMMLEPGLYCVFNAPGSTAARADTGLPGVRITAAPGRRTGRVTVVAFEHDGWIGTDSAALVRVADTAAEVLVTVYQAPDSQGDAPQLQVVRLSPESGDAPAQNTRERTTTERATTAQPTTKQTTTADPEVVAHIYGRGDVAAALGDRVGEPGSNRWIEGFGIAPSKGGVPRADIEYQAVLGRGWLSPWSEGGQFCGSRGMSLPILGLRVRLRGASATTHRVVLAATFVDGTRLGPVGDGDACEAPSLAALESFQISIEPIAAVKLAKTKAAKPAAISGAKAKEPAPAPSKTAKAKAAPAAPPVKPTKAAPARRGAPAPRRR